MNPSEWIPCSIFSMILNFSIAKAEKMLINQLNPMQFLARFFLIQSFVKLFCSVEVVDRNFFYAHKNCGNIQTNYTCDVNGQLAC
jgi:hypothetical protein